MPTVHAFSDYVFAQRLEFTRFLSLPLPFLCHCTILRSPCHTHTPNTDILPITPSAVVVEPPQVVVVKHASSAGAGVVRPNRLEELNNGNEGHWDGTSWQ
jgi:hypothetical protein